MPGHMWHEWSGMRYSDFTAKKLGYPTYSPDIAPTHYHLLHHLDIHLLIKSFANEAELRHALTDFFASKSPHFFPQGIVNLEARGQKLLDADGYYSYFED
ncbi:hypothetical protein PR048_019545 [Dryococelus australis]|uniref:Uncharacterized protein n=1 Tax=Dryococelus australis TaxID=614101 RepID=A0ABQ9H3R7_9NEOP|nr:hypothetical protein PR048_019545 [Dryococelus australis]